MKLVFAALLVLAVQADWWTSCGKPDDDITLQSLVFSPPTPVKGQLLNITLDATVNNVISQGSTVKGEVKWGLIHKSFQEDLCGLLTDPQYPQCPIQPGPLHLVISEQVPSSIPGGHYTGNVIAADQDGHEIACFNIDLHM